MTKVSIIIPVYNTEKYIKRCLDSLIQQTLNKIEIICINDGSTDSSLKILEDYAKNDSRIIIKTQKNQGQSAARNNGINIATGEYVGFIDSDDWVAKDYYEKLYNAASKSNADIAVAGIIRLNAIYKKFHLKYNKEEITDDTNQKFELCDVPAKSYVVNKIYKLSKLKEANLKFEEGIFFEDCIFTPEVLYHLGKLITVPNTYYYYWRRLNSTVTKRNPKINKDSEYAHKKAQDFIKNHNIDISSHETKTYRFKIFGITIFKYKKKTHKK